MSLQVAVQHGDAAVIKRRIRETREIAEVWGVELPTPPPEPTWEERQSRVDATDALVVGLLAAATAFSRSGTRAATQPTAFNLSSKPKSFLAQGRPRRVSLVNNTVVT